MRPTPERRWFCNHSSAATAGSRAATRKWKRPRAAQEPCRDVPDQRVRPWTNRGQMENSDPCSVLQEFPGGSQAAANCRVEPSQASLDFVSPPHRPATAAAAGARLDLL